jgi:lipopolysaccharide export system protein LptA
MTARRAATTGWVLAALAAAALLAPPAQAQSAQGVPNALQGFSRNRNQPVQINAASLEVREKDKTATFSGDVRVRQGDTELRSKSLVVYYEDHSAGEAMKTPNLIPGAQQQIRRLEARGSVVVNQKEQTATGDSGVFDMRANTVTLLGNVVVSQGNNVLRGDRLVVDLRTGVSRIDAGSGGGRVQGLFHSGDRPDENPLKLPGPARR